jgi:hypothetical protein
MSAIDDRILTLALDIAEKFLNTYYNDGDPVAYWPPESAIVSYFAENLSKDFLPAPEIRIQYLYENFSAEFIPTDLKRGRIDLVLFDKEMKPVYAIEVKGKSSQWEKFGCDMARLQAIVNTEKPIVSRAAVVYVSCTMGSSGIIKEKEIFNNYVKEASISNEPIHKVYGNNDEKNGLVSMCIISKTIPS